ncbi:MAG: succinyldiaminopimelate transaminase [Neisseria sp.]|nr:succinyldiaminopimelate transaminase [Neisseria sp.]
MNPKLSLLQPYPFEKLTRIMQDITPPAGLTPLALHIGEPKHDTPQLIFDALTAQLNAFAKYPAINGLPELRAACAAWCRRRYGIEVDENHEIIPTLGSREALFSFVQAALDTSKDAQPLVLCPNPFYQIYEGATLLAGGQTVLANTRAPDFLPDWLEVDDAAWARIQIVFVCSPGNPTGAAMKQHDWQQLFALQDRYGFIIASDECYSEIYADTPPVGLLQAARADGRDFSRKIMFTSLSKRSNAPGLRSGFVAGDAAILKKFLHYRTYHGCAMGLPIQHASIAAWNDESHVELNRARYREKFARVLPVLQQKYAVTLPDASFYLWLPVPDGDDIAFARQLWQHAAIQVLPGSLLARDSAHGNAGQGYVRIALVASLAECDEAARRMTQLS